MVVFVIANRLLMGVVLAGGKSSRMGTDKANLIHPHSITGRPPITYLQHAIERLSPWVPVVAVSGRDPNPEYPTEVITIPDHTSYRGPATGVARSLAHAIDLGLGGILVTPVDMPYLTTENLWLLIQAWHHATNCGQSLGPVTATCEDDAGNWRAEPLVAIYPTNLSASIESLAMSNDRSLSRWLGQHSPILVPLPKSAGKNINRPEDVHG